ncbi:MAG: PAS domain S-box protein [Thermodesulfobacteriota bacterium]
MTEEQYSEASLEGLRDTRMVAVKAGQIEQLYAQARTGMYAALAGSIILVAVLWSHIPPWKTFTWLAAFLSLMAWRHVLVSRYVKERPQPEKAEWWGRAFVFGSAGSGLLWGLAAIWLWPPHSILHQCAIAVFLAAAAAAAAVSYAPVKEAYVSSILLILVPLLGRLVVSSIPVLMMLGLIGTTYVLVLMRLGRGIHRLITESISLRLRQTELIDSLRAARDELELRVQQRTAELLAANNRLTEEMAERRRAEEGGLLEKQRFQSLADNTPLGIVMMQQDGTIQYINPKFTEFFGYEREEVPNGRTWLRMACPDDAYRKQVIRAWFEDLEKYPVGESWPRTYTVRCKDGSDKVIHFRTVQLPTSEHIIACEDITLRYKSEEELRKSEKKYRTILETIADGYHEVDLAGNLTLVNDSLCEIVGASREELIGRNYRDFVDVLGAEEVFSQYNEVYRTGQPNPGFSFDVIRKDGKKLHISVSVALTRDEEGIPVGFRGIFRDITEQKQLSEKLTHATKMEAIGTLAGGVAHDFNNLLTAVQGYSDILTRQMPTDSPYIEKLTQISRAAERAAGLTRQLLAFGRKQVLNVSVLNFNDVITDLEQMLRRLIGEDIELITVLAPSLGLVKADAGQIEQILMNLVVNARDAMPKGGKLTIETANVVLDRQYTDKVPELEPGPYVMFAVSDSGIGMDEQTRIRIFDPFFTTKDKGVGTGLGLSTVYGIVKQHRGHIAVYSELRRGTTFKVYLPLEEAEAEEQLIRPRPEVQSTGTETILVVEDEAIVRDLVSEALTMLGYSILAASDPDEAVAMSTNHAGPIHLLVTDVVLPKMDGKSLCSFLSLTRPEMKVLYVSGYTENFIVHRGVLDHGVHFMQKPFTVDDLAAKVREVLDNPVERREI